MHQRMASTDDACTVCKATGSFRQERDDAGTFLVCGTCHAPQDMGVIV